MKRLVIGILAHVDAGKTTLSEGLLYSAGAIDKLGRVDKGDAFLDTYSLERERGITIFSKQALLSFSDTEITLIDTPGHIDFSAEAERALSVEDYAVLVISAPDGVESHTKTLWHLLRKRKIPTFIFINKTDISERTRAEIMEELKEKISPSCCDFSSSDSSLEDIAALDTALMEEYFESGTLSDERIRASIKRCTLFPVFFGSALKMQGVSEFLKSIDRYTEKAEHHQRIFGARVYKIARDKDGKRLTYMKITGGSLHVKDNIEVHTRNGDTLTEKIEEIRVYSGEKSKSVREALAGGVYAILGAEKTEAGMGLGFEKNDETTLTPVLDYKMILPEGTSVYEAYLKILVLAEEDPALALSYNERAKEIRVRLMGEIQLAVLKRMIFDRFGLDVSFGEGSILYKETIEETVSGAGHFEPLRHYAEVHLRLEPLPEGSGIICDTDCSSDLLQTSWQRLVLTHLEEKVHKGVLTGSPITDIKITLTAGRAHVKHTEGGDFRQATYRAVRQGLMKAKSILLEPTFDFIMEIPSANLGRAMTDVTNMKGTVLPPDFNGDTAILTGNAPVFTMRSYPEALRAYTHGEGKITLTHGGYKPCHNSDEVIEKIGYNPELDDRNTPNSVFCKAGAGYVVPWHEADSLMHLSSDDGSENKILERTAYKAEKVVYNGSAEEDKELMAIFERTYGKIKVRKVNERVENSAPKEIKERRTKEKPKGDRYVIIDGYNFIFANEELKNLADKEISVARDTVTRLMCDYCAFNKSKAIIVFDAYKRSEGEGSVERLGDVSVVYTKSAETADSYIEKTTYDMAREHTVRVVTSDFQEQLVILGAGGLRVSAKEFYAELSETSKEIKETIERSK